MSSASMNRRQLIRRTAASCGIMVAAGLVDRPYAVAANPITRNGKAKFKFSLAAYSYRDLLQGDSAPLTLSDFIDDCAAMGLDGTELTSYYFPQPPDNRYIRSLKRQCFLLGLDVSGTAVGNDFGFPPGQRRTQQIEDVKRWIERAEVLGAPVIRVFAGHAKDGVDPQQTHRLIVEGLEECCEYAGHRGIHLALENHGGPTSTAEGILELVRDVDSPWFGVNLDTGNFHSEDIYADLARVAPYAINVQVKVSISGPDRKKRPADFAQLARILRDVHYRGYVVLEYEDAGNPREECPRHMDRLREAFA